MSKRCAIYARVSRDSQSVDLQLFDLRRYCEQRGLIIHHEYIDEGISGVKRNRPALDAMMDAAHKRRFDIVLVWRFDRFARSTQHLLSALDEFRCLGIDFISFQENIDTTSPLGKALFTIVSCISSLERDILRERVRAGVAVARAKGKRLGRPRKANYDEIIRLRQAGLSLNEIGKRLGIPKSTVRDAVRKSPSK